MAGSRILLLNMTTVSGPKGVKGGTKITEKVLSDFTPGQWRQFSVKNDSRQANLEALNKQFDESIDELNMRFDNKVEKLQRGDELPPGVMKMVKVFIAVKRKLQPGDKMAGRHGNKGVISKIVPIEDMPYTETGQSVDIVLNPLGVPSRMNVGQILETHLGWACHGLGLQIGEILDRANKNGKTDELRKRLKQVYGDRSYKDELQELDDEELLELGGNLVEGVPIASPVFDGAREEDIKVMLSEAGLDVSGQVRLTDGRTGETFDRLGDGGLHLHAQAAPPGRRQDPRPFHRPLQPGHPAAAGRQGAVWRPATSARWRSGRWRPTARPTRCRRC